MNPTRLFALLIASLAGVAAQSTPAATDAIALTPTTTLVTAIVSTTVALTLRTSVTVNGGGLRPSSITTGFVLTQATAFIQTYTPTPTSSTASVTSSTPTSTETPSIHLDTKINGPFAVAGILLILSGLPMAFWGHKNRWSSLFLIGFYTLALTCMALILRFGVLAGVRPPTVKLEGLFVLAVAVAGVVGGAIAIFFWKGARYAVGAWGGFAFGLWIQCFRNGGVIRPIGFRWFLYIIFAVIGFVFASFPKFHHATVLISTAAVGASAFILGVDCFSTAGLKEFYLYNLGFDRMFPKFTAHDPPIAYPISQTMMIELGLIGAIALMGGAVQLRFLQVLKAKLLEITANEEEREARREAKAAQQFANVDRDRERWEQEHGAGRDSATLAGRMTEDGKFKSVDLEAGTPTMDTPTVLPVLAFGRRSTARELSSGLVENDSAVEENPELKEKLKILEEIRRVKDNIEAMRRAPSPTGTTFTGLQQPEVATPGASSSTPSRSLSTGSMPIEAVAAVAATTTAAVHTSPTRPPRSANPSGRNRTRSLEAAEFLSSDNPYRLSSTLKIPEDPEKMHWDEYTKDRKLFTPPSGVTPPIPTSADFSPAVREALERRRVFEEAMDLQQQERKHGRRRSTSNRLSIAEPEAGYFDQPPRQSQPVRAGSGGGAPMIPEQDYVESPVLQSQPLPAEVQGRHGHSRSHSAGGIGVPARQQTLQSQLAPVKRQTGGAPDLSRSMSSGGVIVIPDPRPAPSKQVTPTSPSAFSPAPRLVTMGELDQRHRERIRAMQDPLSRQEAEQAQINQAKERWDRSRKVERTVMERKEKTQRKSIDKEQDGVGERRASPPGGGGGVDKVAEWQRRQSSSTKTRTPRHSSSSPAPMEDGRRPSMQSANTREEPILESTPPPSARPQERRMSSRSLQAWNTYSSPGSMRAPPN